MTRNRGMGAGIKRWAAKNKEIEGCHKLKIRLKTEVMSLYDLMMLTWTTNKDLICLYNLVSRDILTYHPLSGMQL